VSAPCLAQAPPSGPYRSPSELIPYGEAPHVKEHRIGKTGAEETSALILCDGDEVMTALTDFAKRHHRGVAYFTAIGAVHDAKVGWFDPGRKQYKVIDVDGQVEVVSLVGDIGDVDGRPVVHAHAVLGGASGEVKGGHLIHAIASPTLEVFISTGRAVLEKKPDAASGITLFQ